MITVQRDFQTRVAEIEAFVSFLAEVDASHILLVKSSDQTAVYPAQQQDDLLRTFKASALLLLYNLMESTVCNAVEAIYDELTFHGTPFDSCRSQVRRVVLRNLKQHELDALLPLLGNIATDVVVKTFQKRKIVSGNVDAKKIREVADDYGFARPAADGAKLLDVKTNRNDLAHGEKSFAEVGRDYPVPEIVAIKDKVVLYLNEMLTGVTDYIVNKHYLSAPGRP